MNAAINIQTSSQNLSGRDAQVFIFSKLFCGSKITGWCPTELLEAIDPQIDLAAAMAISGAAVSPNQGVIPNRPLRFLMAVVNARLGYWLINPAHLSATSGITTKATPYYFLLELLGRLDETRKRVYITDGGHIENLGAYELLRRRCKFIVIVDAEQDAFGAFHGLAHLTRIAKIDFDYEIDLNTVDVKVTASGDSRAHCALGFVHYGISEVGYILYIKATLTGDETEYIAEYKRRSEAFPHESTSDQFFTEEQFEAYQALGFHIGDRIFAEYPGCMSEFFEHLERTLVLDVVDRDSYLKVQKRIWSLDRLKHSTGGRIEIGSLGVDSNLGRAVDSMELSKRRLHAMEFGVLTLKLNIGYIANGPCRNIVSVFHTWMQADEFWEVWNKEAAAFGDELHQFVRETKAAMERRTTDGSMT